MNKQKIMLKWTIILIFSLPIILIGQNDKQKIYGEYSDEFAGNYTTKLVLFQDSTFVLNTVDPEFPYNFQSFKNKGSYIIEENKVILNRLFLCC